MSALNPRVGVAALASPLEVGADRAPQAQSDLAALLTTHGADVVRSDGPVASPAASAAAGRRFAEQHVDALCLGAASWFEDYLVLDLIEECDVPVLLWALPGMETGALCGAQQLTCFLTQLEKPFAAVFGPIAEGRELARGLRFLRAAALRRRLRRARIGAAGSRVYGMTESSPNEIALKKVLGPRVVPVDLPGLLAAAVASVEAQEVWRRIARTVAQVEVDDAEGVRASALYLAIRAVVKTEGLAALAFGCYPGHMGRACLAASLLADEGIPVGCEGDVNAAVGMVILQALTGAPVHNADWLDPLPDGSVILTHCGASSHSLAERPEDIVLRKVRLTCQGVCSLFPARTGPVTLLTLLPRGEEYQMAVLEGEAVSTDMVFPGNPLRVRFPQPTVDILDWIHRQGIGHHWIAGYGRVKKELDDLSLLLGDSLRYLAL